MTQGSPRPESPLPRTASSSTDTSHTSQVKEMSNHSDSTEEGSSTICEPISDTSPSASPPEDSEKVRKSIKSQSRRKRDRPKKDVDFDFVPAYPFPADFGLEFDGGSQVNVISQLCENPEGPSAIALFLPGVHGGVGPCRQPGQNYDSECLYAKVAQRLLDGGAAVDVYRCSWQYMRPSMDYSLSAACRVLHYALKKARLRGSNGVRVILVGHSLGAVVAIHAASLLSHLKAQGHSFLGTGEVRMELAGFCTLNAPANVDHCEGREDVQEALKDLKALLVSGDADEVVSPFCTSDFFKALRSSDKRHLNLPGGTHDLFLYKDILIEEVSNFIMECFQARGAKCKAQAAGEDPESG